MTQVTRSAVLPGLLVVALAWGFPAGVAAEQASQPASAAAGRLDVGKYHACALLAAGGVRCWGYGGDGALGYANRATIGDDEPPAAAGPVELGSGRTATAISAGAVHTCALLDTAAVRCWGFGGDGRLGYGNINAIGDDETPASAGSVDLGRGRTAKAITAGRGHSCAVLDDGSVRCWGFGTFGRLGYGASVSIGDDETPGSVDPVRLGPGRTATAITAGESHTCALLDDGTVRCWGLGANGQLGYGTTSNIGDDETPDTVAPVRLGAGRKAIAISAGSFHTCALLDGGTVRCWGFGGNGRLGYGNTSNIGDDEPADAAGTVDLGPGRTAVAISAGDDHTCAILDDATVRCWGFGGNGRLGYANTADIGDDETPGSAGPVDLGPGRTAVAISAGSASTCARLDDGSVRCWGTGDYGLLGSCGAETIGDDETPGARPIIDLTGVGGSCRAQVSSPNPAAGVPPVGRSDTTTPLPTPSLPSAAPDRLLIALTAQRIRAIALRRCLQHAARTAAVARGTARRQTALARTQTLRRVAVTAAGARRRCVGLYRRIPGRVTGFAARAIGRHTIALTFRASGTNSFRAPAARRYLVKQARRPIRGAGDFRRAHALCRGACVFQITRTNTTVTLTITHLRRRTTYYYAIAARDNVTRHPGPRSRTVRATTR